MKEATKLLQYNTQELIKSGVYVVVLLLLLVGIFLVVRRKYHDTPKQRRYVTGGFIAALVAVLSIFSYCNYANFFFVIRLKADMDQSQVSDRTGVVEEMFTYARSDSGVVINGIKYHLAGSAGDMWEGMDCDFRFYSRSKYIFSFTVNNDEPIPDASKLEAGVGERKLQIDWSDEYGLCTEISDVTYIYLMYYYSEVNTTENFPYASFSAFTYPIPEDTAYRTNFYRTSRKGEIVSGKAYSIIVEAQTGRILCLWSYDYVTENDSVK